MGGRAASTPLSSPASAPPARCPIGNSAGPAQALLRSLLRRLADLEAILQAERNRTDPAADPLLSRSLGRMVRALEKETTTIEKQIVTYLKASPELLADVERLCEIEGIGQCSAWWLCAGVPRHLPNARAAAAWLAVTPRVRQSGTCLRATAPVGSEGNRHLRKVLFMAAWPHANITRA